MNIDVAVSLLWGIVGRAKMAFTSTIAWVLLGFSCPQGSAEDEKRNDVPEARIPLSDTPVGPLSFSKDGKYLVVMLDEKDDVALIDDVKSGHLERSLGGGFQHAAFSPDGQWLADVGDSDILL